MKKATLLSSAITLSLLYMLSCTKNNSSLPNSTCDGVAKNFTTNVNPLIQTYCNQAACHDAGSMNGPGPLTNYAEIFSARTAIKGQVQSGLMPQNTTLTTTQKNTIICWIDSGAPNN